MDEDQNSEEVEITPQDQESTIVEENIPEETSVEDPQGQEETKQDRNWNELRKKAEQSEREAREFKERMDLQEQFIKNLMTQTQPQTAQQKEVDEFEQIPQEEYATFGQTRKLVQKDARTIAREEFERLHSEREQQRFKERLEKKYSDFGEVVNSETIAILEQQEPELATTIADLKDPYKMGLQSYKFIKSLGIVPSKDEKRHAREVEKKIAKNEKTVQSPQAYDKRPMAQAFSTMNMSDNEKKSLYEETLKYASMSPGY